MALNIKDRETHDLARILAEQDGTTMTQAVQRALRESIARRERKGQPKLDRLEEIARHCASLPVLDERTAEEIAGYDDLGLPQ